MWANGASKGLENWWGEGEAVTINSYHLFPTTKFPSIMGKVTWPCTWDPTSMWEAGARTTRPNPELAGLGLQHWTSSSAHGTGTQVVGPIWHKAGSKTTIWHAELGSNSAHAGLAYKLNLAPGHGLHHSFSPWDQGHR